MAALSYASYVRSVHAAVISVSRAVRCDLTIYVLISYAGNDMKDEGVKHVVELIKVRNT